MIAAAVGLPFTKPKKGPTRGGVFLSHVRRCHAPVRVLRNGCEVNASGLIDSGDVFLTRQRTGTQLPTPP